jgi:hypothetical protein
MIYRRFFSSSNSILSLIDTYASSATNNVTLTHLLELSKDQSTIDNARYLQSELPKRLARRVKGIFHIQGI